MKNPEQELQFKFRMLEQQIMAIQQQLQAVEQAIIEISSLNIGLDEIKKEKEILAQVGKGIFVKAKILSEDLTIDIGNKSYIKKSIPKTKEMIQEQIQKLEEIKEDLNKELEKINNEITNVMMEHQEKAKKD